VADAVSIERAARAVHHDPGALDALVNNAGIGADFGVAGAARAAASSRTASESF